MLYCLMANHRTRKPRKPSKGNSFADKYPVIAALWHQDNGYKPDEVSPKSHYKASFEWPNTPDHPYKDHIWVGLISEVTRTWEKLLRNNSEPDVTQLCFCCTSQKKTIVYSMSLAGIAELGEWNREKRRWELNKNAIRAFEEWDYKRNNISPKQISPYSNKKYHFVCKADPSHSFVSILNNRVGKGHGCRFCSGVGPKQDVLEDDSLQKFYPDLADLLISLVPENEIKKYKNSPHQWKRPHVDTVNTNVASEIRPSSNKYAWWRCENNPSDPAHFHYATFSAKTRLVKGKKPGCAVCANRQVTEANSLRSYIDGHYRGEKNWVRNEFVSLTSNKGDSRDTLGWSGEGPDLVSFESHVKATWLCGRGHETTVPVYKRAKEGKRCAQCKFPGYAQILISTDLKEEFFYDLVSEYRFDNIKKFRFDMFIPSIKLALEFDPHYTHKSEDQRDRDLRKNRALNYYYPEIRLIRLRESPLEPLNKDTDVTFEEFNGHLTGLKEKIMGPLLEKIGQITDQVDNDKAANYLKINGFKYSAEAERNYQKIIGAKLA